MKEILQEPWLYSLYEDGESLILSVVCGTVAVYDLTIELTTEEKQQFATLGKPFLHTLALQISSRPSDYQDRKC
jgi:hypothetical protein